MHWWIVQGESQVYVFVPYTNIHVWDVPFLPTALRLSSVRTKARWRNSLCHLLSSLSVMLFQQDATSSRHILTLQCVLAFLDRKLPRKWMGRSIPVSWPLRSRGLTPLDLFFWWNVEGTLCVPPLPTTLPELPGRIQAAAATITPAVLADAWTEKEYRWTCQATHGFIERLWTLECRSQNTFILLYTPVPPITLSSIMLKPPTFRVLTLFFKSTRSYVLWPHGLVATRLCFGGIFCVPFWGLSHMRGTLKLHVSPNIGIHLPGRWRH